MQKDLIVSIADILKLLSDKTRLSMMSLLFIDDCCVCEFVDVLKMSQPSISQHLRKLKDANLVREQRKGQWIFYSLNHDNDYLPLVKDILSRIPNQEETFTWLKDQGLRKLCT